MSLANLRSHNQGLSLSATPLLIGMGKKSGKKAILPGESKPEEEDEFDVEADLEMEAMNELEMEREAAMEGAMEGADGLLFCCCWLRSQ